MVIRTEAVRSRATQLRLFGPLASEQIAPAHDWRRKACRARQECRQRQTATTFCQGQYSRSQRTTIFRRFERLFLQQRHEVSSSHTLSRSTIDAFKNNARRKASKELCLGQLGGTPIGSKPIPAASRQKMADRATTLFPHSTHALAILQFLSQSIPFNPAKFYCVTSVKFFHSFAKQRAVLKCHGILRECYQWRSSRPSNGHGWSFGKFPRSSH